MAENLQNQIVEATFRSETDRGYAFELEGGEEAVVDADEYEREGIPWEEGERTRLLVDGERNGRWRASARKVEKLEVWDWLERVRDEQEFVEGDILRENRGGLSVDIGVRAFLPRSHVELHSVDDCSDYVGRRERFTVIKFDQDRCNIVVSRRNVLEAEREERREETIAEIEEGGVFEGIVRNLQDYGAFVDIGGIDGLLHISNISWGRVDHPSEVLSPGERVEVEVLEFDRDEERLSLGRKQLLDDPWETFADEHDEGEIVEGEVVSLADFGAFVEVAPGVEGLVHVTELSWVEQTNHPGQFLEAGDEIEVKIIDIDQEENRVSLSRKRTEPNPWELVAEEVEVGDEVAGEITSITDFGIFVEVREDVEGLVHISDLSWTEQIDDISEHYDVGEEVEAKVLELDVEGQRLGLGIKQLSEDPWAKAERVAEPGEMLEVEITKLTDFGAFAEVVEGVEGLIHISELAERRIDKPREVVRPGETVEALVLSFDGDEERISLSVTKESLEEEEASEYVDEEGGSAKLGDVIGDQLREASSEDERDGE